MLLIMYSFLSFSHSRQSFLNILLERDKSWSNAWSFISWKGWWANEMVVANFRCRSLACGGCVRDLDRWSMTSF
jgi:hypothetical protein